MANNVNMTGSAVVGGIEKEYRQGGTDSCRNYTNFRNRFGVRMVAGLSMIIALDLLITKSIQFFSGSSSNRQNGNPRRDNPNRGRR